MEAFKSAKGQRSDRATQNSDLCVCVCVWLGEPKCLTEWRTAPVSGHLCPFVGCLSRRIKASLLSFEGCKSLSSGMKAAWIWKGAGLERSLQEVACFYFWSLKLRLHNLLLFHFLSIFASLLQQRKQEMFHQCC